MKLISGEMKLAGELRSTAQLLHAIERRSSVRQCRSLLHAIERRLEQALKGQDDLVDEFTIRVTKIGKETLQRDQLMRDKEELSIARKGKKKEVDHPLNRNLDKVWQVSASLVKSKPSPL
ncbi:hypothetical protein LWI29_012205 [Acer saccharum]|uniref:Uncharacterized protein n=1 Tax=Acer saccharum TaxID=4024 RepID=A0AA39W971_ACESA|nr:hypothetical protein LWI29_012205 [Acer saccharum]